MNWLDVIEACFGSTMVVIIGYTLGISLTYFVLMVLGYFALRHQHGRLLRSEREALFKSPLIPRISVLVPAHNEEATILHSVKALITLHYPSHEVVVVNDGSTDETLDRLIEEFRLYRSVRIPTGNLPTEPIRGIYESRDPIPLVVVDKENGGKGDALNAALNVSRAPLIAAVDADSILEPDSLLHVMKPFLEDIESDCTLATGGIVRVANGCQVEHGRIVRVGAPRSLLAAFQAIEYLRAFLGGRIAYSFLNSLLVISGAFGVFRRDAVVEAGGFDTDTVGEDMELIVRLHRLWRTKARHEARNGRVPGRYRIVFVPEPVSWTEVPETLEMLARQRNRWQRGLTESLWIHRRMAFNPSFGMVGLFGFPYFILLEMLGPTIELIGYLIVIPGLAFGFMSWQLALMFFLVSIGFGTLLSISALLLEELTVRRYPRPGDVIRLSAAAVAENFGLRQLLTVWRTKALMDAFRGKKDWGPVERRGFADAAGAVAKVTALLLLLALVPAPTVAQVREYRWGSAFQVEVHDFTSHREPWSTWFSTTMAVERVTPAATLRVEGIETRRFDDRDVTVGADLWADVGPRSYANARLHITPDASTRPALDLGLAFFGGVGEGWELGGGWHHQRYERTDTDIDAVAVSIARYVDRWYLRGGSELVRKSRLRGAGSVLARWYFDPPRDLIEIGFVYGQGAELVGPGPEVAIGRLGLGHVRLDTFPWTNLGVGLATDIRSFEDLPARYGLSASVKVRW